MFALGVIILFNEEFTDVMVGALDRTTDVIRVLVEREAAALGVGAGGLPRGLLDARRRRERRALPLSTSGC